MDWFYLQPFSLLALTQAIIALFIALYLLRIKNKTRATWMLALVIGAFAVSWGIKFIDYSESSRVPLPIALDPLPAMMIGIVLFGCLHFAYAFLENPFPRESKIIFWLSLAFVAVHMLYGGYQVVTHADMPAPVVFILEFGYLAMMFWTTGLFFRKKRRLSTEAGHVRMGHNLVSAR